MSNAIPGYEPGVQLSCPVCGNTIVLDVTASIDKAVCDKCRASVEVSASKKQEAENMREFSKQFMK